MTHLLENLNPTQRAAAEKTEGSALALAGPGSGKTQTLALRIANMLLKGITPNMILCLTFTEAGVVAMRKRLVQFIGPTAYQVAIHTFHSFCNEIIQGNPDYFGIKEFEPVSDLERIEISYAIIDGLPVTHGMKRLRGDIYYDSRRMLNLFQLMKEENWDYQYVKQGIENYLNSLSDKEEFIYKRANKKRDIQVGDVKKAAIEKEKEKLEKLDAAASLLKTYDDELKKAERYDFTDMIRWVYDAWTKDEFFLLNYQERYQYLLVDEFQDTNRMQLGLIDRLMDFWDDPNIFAVGDPQQTLYEFSGARIANIVEFIEKYNPEIFSFIENYRSNEYILRDAEKIIVLNTDKLGEHKPLLAATDKGNAEPVVFEFPNTTMETSRIIRMIEKSRDSGQKLSETGIIYRKHRQADDLIRQFEARGIPYNVKRSINVLDTIVIKQLLDIIAFIVNHDGLRQNDYDSLLFKILHFGFWNNDYKKVHRYYLSLQDKDARSRKPVDIIKTEKILGELIQLYHNVPTVSLINHILEDSGLMEWVIKNKNYLQLVQYINTFFNWIKGEAFKRPDFTGKDLIFMIEKMRKNGLYLPTVDVQGFSDGVNLMTVHGAKGLEYDHVIMMGCTRNEWEGSRSGSMNYSLPDTLTLSVKENKLESNRRLFYVGMTRARRWLTISYASQNNEGKDLEPSQFIIETEIPPVMISKEDLSEYMRYHFKSREVVLDIERVIIQERLDNFIMSLSSMNKYLQCQLTFYYENIIRVPFVANAALIFGNAGHLVMQKLYDNHRKGITLSENDLLEIFSKYMDKNRAQITEQEVQLRMELGRNVIDKMLTDYWPISNKITLSEFKVRRVTINGVPCKGDVDKIEFTGNDIVLVDYKTGNPTSAKKKMNGPTDKVPLGGEYWRQKVFYKLAMDAMPAKEWRVTGFRLDILHQHGVEMIPAEITNQEEQFVRKLIKTTYDGIMAAKFDGCGEDDCIWCNLMKT